MLSNQSMKDIKKFFELFSTSLYDTGYNEAILTCGLKNWEDHNELVRGLTYMKGFSDACRIACNYMSRSWMTANTMGIMSGTLVCYIDMDYWVNDALIQGVLHTYKSELLEQLSQDKEAIRSHIERHEG